MARRLSFILALAVLGVALAFGSGLGASGTPSDAQRVAALESRVRCPSCEDISVAESTSTSAIAVRHEIAQLVAAGRSDRVIESRLVAQYGSSILLAPPDSGLGRVVWLVPLVAGVIAAGALGVLLWRRAGAFRRLREAT